MSERLSIEMGLQSYQVGTFTEGMILTMPELGHPSAPEKVIFPLDHSS